MNYSAQNAKRSSRSNMYSESKSSNWMPFDPYEGERAVIQKNVRPTLIYKIGESDVIGIYERPLHAAFMRPYSTSDVVEMLDSVPKEFLAGMEAIYLMGGTSKQEKIAKGDLYRYGQYSLRKILLFAYPRRRFEWRGKQLPKPSVRHEFERAGATFEQYGDEWVCRRNEAVLKTFYMSDVLIHEIGHHVDHHTKSRTQSEKFAEWFVREYGFRRNK